MTVEMQVVEAPPGFSGRWAVCYVDEGSGRSIVEDTFPERDDALEFGEELRQVTDMAVRVEPLLMDLPPLPELHLVAPGGARGSVPPRLSA